MSAAHFSTQAGGITDLSTHLFEKRPPITVDRNGGLFHYRGNAKDLILSLVGKIWHKPDSPANTCPNHQLGIIPPNPSFIPGEIEHEATNLTESPGSEPPSPRGYPPKDFTGCGQDTTTEVGSFVFKSIRSRLQSWVHRTVSRPFPYSRCPNDTNHRRLRSLPP